MALTKKDLESIESIVKNIVDDSIGNAINGSEAKMMQYIASQFRIQNIVLDTRFRSIDSRFDSLEKRMSEGFSKTNKYLHERDVEIETLKERVDHIEEQIPLAS
ncbi:MAG: hypothetical protein O3B87_03295 [bacterium]|nr:hypothetical protein [bacterium]